jgi:hypothetical protein
MLIAVYEFHLPCRLHVRPPISDDYQRTVKVIYCPLVYCNKVAILPVPPDGLLIAIIHASGSEQFGTQA